MQPIKDMLLAVAIIAAASMGLIFMFYAFTIVVPLLMFVLVIAFLMHVIKEERER